MLRLNLAEARRMWLDASKRDPDGYERRQQSDFLVEINHKHERLDFHSLRHTCGSWPALTGGYPKEVQSVLRHASIVLTMDSYGPCSLTKTQTRGRNLGQ